MKINLELIPPEIRRSAKVAARHAEAKMRRVRRDITEDIDAIMERDPAATSRTEAALLYSGFHALMMYRASHALHERGHKHAARFVSQSARFLTGIEIHPGATIGRGLFIDHGSGVVIGETAIIGDNSKIAAGAVVLGDVPEHSTAVGIPAKVVRRRGERVENDCDLDQTHIPDPVAEALCAMRAEIASLRAEISALENKNDTDENGKK